MKITKKAKNKKRFSYYGKAKKKQVISENKMCCVLVFKKKFNYGIKCESKRLRKSINSILKK